MTLLSATNADRRLMPDGRLAGPMPWVLAIMAFLTALATATGIGLADSAASLKDALNGRLTIQVVDANPDARVRTARALQQGLGRIPGVKTVVAVSDEQMRDLLAPWLGETQIDPDLPVPALIDVTLRSSDARAFATVTNTVRTIAPAARVDRQEAWLAPLSDLLHALTWLAVVVVGLMVAAMVAAVILSSRAALVAHGETIAVMHLMGASDAQIARLFQRRAVLDTLFGSVLGVALAVLAILTIGRKLAEIGTAIPDQGGLGIHGWLALGALPLAAIVIALITARLTVLRALARML